MCFSRIPKQRGDLPLSLSLRLINWNQNLMSIQKLGVHLPSVRSVLETSLQQLLVHEFHKMWLQWVQEIRWKINFVCSKVPPQNNFAAGCRHVAVGFTKYLVNVLTLWVLVRCAFRISDASSEELKIYSRFIDGAPSPPPKEEGEIIRSFPSEINLHKVGKFVQRNRKRVLLQQRRLNFSMSRSAPLIKSLLHVYSAFLLSLIPRRLPLRYRLLHTHAPCRINCLIKRPFIRTYRVSFFNAFLSFTREMSKNRRARNGGNELR